MEKRNYADKSKEIITTDLNTIKSKLSKLENSLDFTHFELRSIDPIWPWVISFGFVVAVFLCLAIVILTSGSDDSLPLSLGFMTVAAIFGSVIIWLAKREGYTCFQFTENEIKYAIYYSKINKNKILLHAYNTEEDQQTASDKNNDKYINNSTREAFLRKLETTMSSSDNSNTFITYKKLNKKTKKCHNKHLCKNMWFDSFTGELELYKTNGLNCIQSTSCISYTKIYFDNNDNIVDIVYFLRGRGRETANVKMLLTPIHDSDSMVTIPAALKKEFDLLYVPAPTHERIEWVD